MAPRYEDLSRVEQFELDRQAGDRLIRRRNLHRTLPMVVIAPIVVFGLVSIGGAVVNSWWYTSGLNPLHKTNPVVAAHTTLLAGGEITLIACVLALVALLAVGRAAWGGSETRVERHQAARVGRNARRDQH